MPDVRIATVGIGGWYPRGVARMIERFHEVSHGFELQAWVNTLPPGAPASVRTSQRDYTAYCAKPFALRALRDSGAEIGILLDAAFYPIRPIHPLVDHISQVGYYLCRNGFNVGEWCQDSALKPLGITREESFQIPEASSYCVGLNFHEDVANQCLDKWCEAWPTFVGPHTNTKRSSKDPGFPTRNPGWCSDDPRVNGHRHDQTALSVIAYQFWLTDLVRRPIFTAYAGQEGPETVLVNRGGI